MQSNSESQHMIKRVGQGVLIVLLFLAGIQWLFPQSLSVITDMYWKLFGNIARVDYQYTVTVDQEKKLATTQAALYHSIFDYVELQRLRQENNELRQILQFSSSTRSDLLGTTVLGEAKLGAIQYFIIDRGSRDNIEKGYPIIAGDGILVGIVTEVGFSTSYVVPVQENVITLSSRLLAHEGRIHGVVEGVPGLATRLQLIPEDIELETGQIVITSGLDPLIPGDLVIGYIDSIVPTPNSFFQSALIDFAGSYTEFETLFVLSPTNLLP